MANSNLVFKGYGVHDVRKWSDFEIIDIKPKQWEEEDIDIIISHCGVCGTDIHTITGSWGNLKHLPLVVGHEIVGTVVRVGSVAAEKSGIKVGDYVGVGAHVGSCGECRACKSDNENYCPRGLDTYNSLYPDGTLTQGGWGTAIRANHQFVFPIPKVLKPEHAASMMCAGLTMYSPLARNGAGPGKKVGIIGLGGLGHFGVLFAKALGAEVYVFSHSPRKERDAKALGADHFIISERAKMKPLRGTLDVLISTVDVAEGFPLRDYLKWATLLLDPIFSSSTGRLLFVNGTFVNVGIPDGHLPQIMPYDIVANGCRLAGSLIGSKKEAMEMLKLAADRDIRPWVEVFPMSKIKEAVEGMRAGKPKYRYVLRQDLT